MSNNNTISQNRYRQRHRFLICIPKNEINGNRFFESMECEQPNSPPMAISPTLSCITGITSTTGECSEEYVFTNDEYSNSLLLGLNELREKNEFCDVTLQVGKVKFPAHKNVLASFSPFFKTMFQSKYVESCQDTVNLKIIDSDMMRIMLNYAYTSSLTITKTNCQSLLSAANLLQVIPVKDAACKFLESHMDTTNCLGICCFAESHSCIDLQSKSFAFALKNFWSVSQSEEFLELSIEKLIELTNHDKLEVEKEEQVFLAVKKWSSERAEDRSQDFHKVLETVRLPLIDPYFLYDCVQTFPPIKQSPECMNLVEEAKLYHLLPDRNVDLVNKRYMQRDNANIAQVILAVGGEDDKVVLRSVECFSPEYNAWYTRSSLSFAISKHGVVASGNNYLYLAGGELPDGRVSNSFYRYDPILDSWQELTPMKVYRSELGLAALDGFIYAVGGWDCSYRLDTVERYDPRTNSWKFVKKLKIAVTSAAVIGYDKMLYVAGGAVLEEGDGINTVQRYDPRTDTWTQLAPMQIARSGAVCCVLDGLIYIIGGWYPSTENTNRIERYNVARNRWEKVASMQERRYRPGAYVIFKVV